MSPYPKRTCLSHWPSLSAPSLLSVSLNLGANPFPTMQPLRVPGKSLGQLLAQGWCYFQFLWVFALARGLGPWMTPSEGILSQVPLSGIRGCFTRPARPSQLHLWTGTHPQLQSQAGPSIHVNKVLWPCRESCCPVRWRDPKVYRTLREPEDKQTPWWKSFNSPHQILSGA